MDFQTYIKPELLNVSVVLYIIGLIITHTEKVENKYIPAILGVVGIMLCVLYVVAVEGVSTMGLFTSITQGVLVAGVAVYTNQLIKQASKDE